MFSRIFKQVQAYKVFVKVFFDIMGHGFLIAGYKWFSVVLKQFGTAVGIATTICFCCLLSVFFCLLVSCSCLRWQFGHFLFFPFLCVLLLSLLASRPRSVLPLV